MLTLFTKAWKLEACLMKRSQLCDDKRRRFTVPPHQHHDHSSLSWTRKFLRCMYLYLLTPSSFSYVPLMLAGCAKEHIPCKTICDFANLIPVVWILWIFFLFMMRNIFTPYSQDVHYFMASKSPPPSYHNFPSQI
jgi:hypothetical protein